MGLSDFDRNRCDPCQSTGLANFSNTFSGSTYARHTKTHRSTKDRARGSGSGLGSELGSESGSGLESGSARHYRSRQWRLRQWRSRLGRFDRLPLRQWRSGRRAPCRRCPLGEPGWAERPPLVHWGRRERCSVRRWVLRPLGSERQPNWERPASCSALLALAPVEPG